MVAPSGHQPGAESGRLVPVSGVVSEQLAAVRAGDVRQLARLISRVENPGPDAEQVLRDLGPSTAHSIVLGITGSPGVGKSTTTNALISAYRAKGQRVAVLAVDPSSPFSGGALLGDRVRMQDHAGDDGVYIRSMASRGHLGGLAAATPQVMRVLDAAGFDVIVIETVGVGQSEIEIAATADSSIVLVAPGMGDGIQAAKAGILEIGDVFAVNKSDRDGADTTVRELRAMIELGTWSGWKPPVVKTVASTGVGIDDLVTAVEEHQAWLHASGERRMRRLRRIREEITALVVGATRRELQAKATELDALCVEVLEGRVDEFEAAVRLR